MEMNNNINYEDYIGREVREFKFEDGVIVYNPPMDDYFGRVGRIVNYLKENGVFTVQFDDDFWNYPADLVIKQLEQEEDLAEMMEKDEEAGIYDSSDDDSEPDLVNNPPHYTTGRIEVIDFIEDKGLGFHLGNCVKYIVRAGKKDPTKTVEDINKAIWYLERYISRL